MATAVPRLTKKNKDMGKSYEEILAAVEGVRTEVLPGANTSARVGGVLRDILELHEGSSTTVRALIRAEQNRALMAEQALRDGINTEESHRSSADKTLTDRLDVEGTGLMTVDEMINFNPIANEGGGYLVGYLDKPSRYVVTKKVDGVPVNVGILYILSDSSQHVYTQVFTTHFVLDNSGNLDLGAHSDTKLVTYFRSFSIDSPLIDSGTWTKWKDISHDEDALRKSAQTLTDSEKTQARKNIGAASTDDYAKAINDLNKQQGEFESGIRNVVENYKPIVINGNVSNAADEEDITADENR